MNLKDIKIRFFYIQILKDSANFFTFAMWATFVSTRLAHSKNKGPMASGRLGIWNPVYLSDILYVNKRFIIIFFNEIFRIVALSHRYKIGLD